MKIRLLLATLACALLTVSGVRAEEDTTPLGEKMDNISKAFRALGRQVKDSTKNEDSLAKVAVIKQNATEALKFEPKKKASIPADQQGKFVSDFQEKLKAFIADVDTLEAALKKGDNVAASAAFDKLGADQKEGHKEFKGK